MNAAVSRSRSDQPPGLVVGPQQRQQQRRDHRVDVDAEDVRARALLVERQHQLAVEGVEHIVAPGPRHVLRHEPLARVVVDRLALEDRVMHARQRPQLGPHLLRRLLLAAVGLGEVRRHRLQVDAVAGSDGSVSPLSLNWSSRKAIPSKPLPPWL